MSLGAMLQLARKDVTVRSDAPSELVLDKHAQFILSYERNKDGYEYTMMEYLRMSGVYWCVCALHLCGKHNDLPVDDIVAFVARCQHVEAAGGFGASDGHDEHLLHTLSAVQILTMYDRLDAIDKEKAVSYVASLQQKDGSFVGDEWGENDTRFSFCAVACLALLNRLDAIDRDAAIEHILRCVNFDGGFGTRPGSESHAGQIYCCVGALSILGALQCIDADRLGWWLAERQLPSGGLNGRPEKLPDVCYSWWVLASIATIGRLHWVDEAALRRYILACQDVDRGGFADRPDDVTDPFHTLFGLAGLSLMGERSLATVSPVYCMPQSVIDKAGAEYELLAM